MDRDSEVLLQIIYQWLAFTCISISNLRSNDDDDCKKLGQN